MDDKLNVTSRVSAMFNLHYPIPPRVEFAPGTRLAGEACWGARYRF
jgi:hypothetical protein